MSRLPYGMTFLLAATMAIAVVQLEVTSSVGATQFQPARFEPARAAERRQPVE